MEKSHFYKHNNREATWQEFFYLAQRWTDYILGILVIVSQCDPALCLDRQIDRKWNVNLSFYATCRGQKKKTWSSSWGFLPLFFTPPMTDSKNWILIDQVFHQKSRRSMKPVVTLQRWNLLIIINSLLHLVFLLKANGLVIYCGHFIPRSRGFFISMFLFW